MMRFLIVGLCCFLVSCGGVEKRLDHTRALVAQGGYKSGVIETSTFPLYMAAPLVSNFMPVSAPLRVVIEGDGYAWVSRSRLSGDPTPMNPVGLSLAMGADSVYLARPCQYVRNERCRGRYWSSDRFAPEVMGAYMEALDQLKVRYGASRLHLTGFSGGAYVALVLAAQRDDVVGVDTVAGLLDPQAWTDYHRITPLDITRSPRALLMGSADVPFSHACSEDDKVVPCRLSRDFADKARGLGLSNHSVQAFSGFSHETLWTQFSF